MIKKFIGIILTSVFLYSCVGSSSVGVFGSGVSIAFDPRTVGMQIDDSIMQKNLISRLTLAEKKYLLSISVKVLDKIDSSPIGNIKVEFKDKVFFTDENGLILIDKELFPLELKIDDFEDPFLPKARYECSQVPRFLGFTFLCL